MFPSIFQRWNKIGEITFIRATLVPNEASSDNVCGHRTGGAVKAQLVKPFDLSRKAEQRRCVVLVPDEDPELVQDFPSTEAPKLLTLMGRSNNFDQVIIKKLSQFGNSVADDVVK